MKKLFTILAATLFCTGLWADDEIELLQFSTAAITDEFTISHSEGAVGTSEELVVVKADEQKAAVLTLGSVKGSATILTTKDSYENISVISLEVGTSDRGKQSYKIEVSPKEDFSSNVTTIQVETLANALPTPVSSNAKPSEGKYNLAKNTYELSSTVSGYVRITASQASGSSNKIAYVSNVVITTSEPSTDPVINAADASIKALKSGVEVTEEVAVTGAKLTGSTLTATLSPAVTGLSVTLESNAIVDGAILTNAVLHYTQTENASGTTKLTLSDGTTSKEVTITYVSSVEVKELKSISESTSWDFSKITCNTKSELYSNEGIKFTSTSNPSTSDEIVYINYAEGNLWTLATGFDGETMAFKGEYPTRKNAYCQNGVLRFNTTVAGKIVVKFSDTGTSASTSAVKRYLVVNGDQTTYWTSREKTGDGAYDAQLNVTSGEIAVSAGDVTITGSSAIVVSMVTFTKDGGTALDNAEVAEKALKVIENGQLFIIKNGVKYNAQGAVVK